MGGGGSGYLRDDSLNDVTKLISHVGLRPVPEPGTALLTGLGLLGIAALRRSRLTR